MEASGERVEARAVDARAIDVGRREQVAISEPLHALGGSVRRTIERFATAVAKERWAILVYAGSRVLLLLLAGVDGILQHQDLVAELTNWDGFWYLKLAAQGYPSHVEHVQTTLGFFPLYPMVFFAVAHVLRVSLTLAGLIVSAGGGLAATILVRRLAARWWGERDAQRAVLLFCLFPGSVVFSMVYSEGLLIPLAAGCILALENRRWLLAGVLAAFATAVGPDALAIVPVCAVASLVEIRRRGWRDRAGLRSLIAPLLAPVGILAVGAFLWTWTGSPFATFIAQRYGWGERTTPLALVDQARTLAGEISLSRFDYHDVNLNIIAGLLGAVLLLVGALLLLRERPLTVSVEGLVWTLGIGFLAVTSRYTPPNPRILITAFPVVLVLAHRLKRRGFAWCICVSTVLLLAMSAVTYVGIALRP